MGLFKRNSNSKAESNDDIATINQALFRDLTQDVAITMYESKITQSPMLKFLKNDSGIFYNVFEMEMRNSLVSQLKNQSINTYLFALGMHAMGAGIYTVVMQTRLKKPASEYTEEEVIKVLTDLRNTDPYELALNTLGITVDSQNKKVLDHIIMVCLNSTKEKAGENVLNKDSLMTMMQVLFNAGVTLIMK